jgi:hypothetical protein
MTTTTTTTATTVATATMTTMTTTTTTRQHKPFSLSISSSVNVHVSCQLGCVGSSVWECMYCSFLIYVVSTHMYNKHNFNQIIYIFLF